MTHSSRDAILRRRARFLAATLGASLGAGCASAPASNSVEDQAAQNAPPLRSATAAPAATTAPAASAGNPTPSASGGATASAPSPPPPKVVVSVCLSIIRPAWPRFAVNSATLAADQRAAVEQLAALLRERTEVGAVIVGHSDPQEANGQALSEARARAVEAVLLQLGVPPNRLCLQWHGASQPLVHPSATSGRAANRRVEFNVHQPADPCPPTTP